MAHQKIKNHKERDIFSLWFRREVEINSIKDLKNLPCESFSTLANKLTSMCIDVLMNGNWKGILYPPDARMCLVMPAATVQHQFITKLVQVAAINLQRIWWEGGFLITCVTVRFPTWFISSPPYTVQDYWLINWGISVRLL